jgi:hypothetical protein
MKRIIRATVPEAAQNAAKFYACNVQVHNFTAASAAIISSQQNEGGNLQ